MKIDRVTYMLMAQDMDRAVAFYRDVIPNASDETIIKLDVV